MAVGVIARTLNTIDDVLASQGSVDEKELPSFVDGRLTSFERVPVELRQDVLARLEEEALYRFAVPQSFAHALGMYPTAPGRWLIMPWINRGLSVDWEVAQEYLSRILVQSLDGRGLVATRSKAFVCGRYAKSGRFFVAEGVALPFDLMHKYPFGLSDDEMQQVDAISRAMFMGLLGPEFAGDDTCPTEEWARVFWRSNWRIYPCAAPDGSDAAQERADAIKDRVAAYRDRIDALYCRFLDVALRSDPDLFAPDRYEVLTGITSRSLRLGAAMAMTPLLWSDEHGAPIVRSAVESLIVLRWLIARNSPELFIRFKEYGRGRLKLLKLHLEEYVDALDAVPPDLETYLEYLNTEVNNEVMEEFQDISLHSSFSGLSARDMAKEVGMELEYRLQFAPASSTTHGEWSTLDRYVLRRCSNPLHGGHRLPPRSLGSLFGGRLVETMFDLVEEVLDEYIEAVGGGAAGDPIVSGASSLAGKPLVVK